MEIPPTPPPLDDDSKEPKTMAALVWALVSCPHPERCQVSVSVASNDQTREITWCGACGAISPDQGPDRYWQKPAIQDTFKKEHFREVADLARAPVVLQRAAYEAADLAAQVQASLVGLGHALRSLLETAVARDAARIEEIARAY